MKEAVLFAYQWREIILVPTQDGQKKDPTGFPTQFTAHFPFPSTYPSAGYIILLALFFQAEALFWWIVESTSVPQGTEDNITT